MKKLLILALAALVAGASFSPVQAEKKKKKKKNEAAVVEAEVPQPVVLANGSDSLSYAAGMMMTNGLASYLQQQLKVDTACMADFVRGFNDAIADTDDPHELAVRAGRQIADQLKQGMLPRIKADFTGTPDSIVNTMLYRGFTDAMIGDSTVMAADWAQTFFADRQAYNNHVKVEKLSQPGRDFLKENRTKEGVITTPSGLQYKVLVKGEGDVPQPTDKVKVNYEGRLIDGTVFDASSKHGTAPATFPANQVIRGWTEALTMMPVGSKWQLYIPQELGYGDRQAGHIPPYSTLIFDIELVGIEK